MEKVKIFSSRPDSDPEYPSWMNSSLSAFSAKKIIKLFLN